MDMESEMMVKPPTTGQEKNMKATLVIDLTLAIRPITKSYLFADNHATGSHHDVIECDVEADRQEEGDYERVVGWN